MLCEIHKFIMKKCNSNEIDQKRITAHLRLRSNVEYNSNSYRWATWSYIYFDIHEDDVGYDELASMKKSLVKEFAEVKSFLHKVPKLGLDPDDMHPIVVIWGKGGFASSGVYNSWREARDICHNIRFALYWYVDNIEIGWRIMKAIFSECVTPSSIRLVHSYAPHVLTNLDIQYAPIVFFVLNMLPPISVVYAYKSMLSYAAFTHSDSTDELLMLARKKSTWFGRANRKYFLCYDNPSYIVSLDGVERSRIQTQRNSGAFAHGFSVPGINHIDASRDEEANDVESLKKSVCTRTSPSDVVPEREKCSSVEKGSVFDGVLNNRDACCSPPSSEMVSFDQKKDSGLSEKPFGLVGEDLQRPFHHSNGEPRVPVLLKVSPTIAERSEVLGSDGSETELETDLNVRSKKGSNRVIDADSDADDENSSVHCRKLENAVDEKSQLEIGLNCCASIKRQPKKGCPDVEKKTSLSDVERNSRELVDTESEDEKKTARRRPSFESLSYSTSENDENVTFRVSKKKTKKSIRRNRRNNGRLSSIRKSSNDTDSEDNGSISKHPKLECVHMDGLDGESRAVSS